MKTNGKLRTALAIGVGAVTGLLTQSLDNGISACQVIEGDNEWTYYLIVRFNDVKGEIDEFCIKMSNKEKLKNFIARYKQEIELTKQTNRPALSEVDYVGRTIKILCLIVFMSLVVYSCCFLPIKMKMTTTNSSSNNSMKYDGNTQLLIQKNKIGAQNTWVSSGDRCVIRNVGTKMTVSGHTPDDAVIEVDGVYAEGCKTVAAGFDTSKPMDVKCTSAAADKIKLSTDRSFIRRMRKSKEMKLTLPTAADETRTITYTLMGFSDACPWSK